MIPISVIDGKGFVFDVGTVKILREKYNLPGVLSGTLPQFPQQNIFNGLPLQLLPEEVQYLLDSGEFFLQDDETMHSELAVAEESSPDPAEKSVTIHASTPSSQISHRPELPVDYIKPDPAKYDIFKYLVDRKFFVLPGLRFGCQFMAYPGDYMRYHSHYNVIGTSWTRPFKIIDVVNGGRLATSVKKCWVIGAKKPAEEEPQVFSIEWAGFG